MLGVVKTERTIFGYEGAVDVVDVLGALAVGEGGVEDQPPDSKRMRKLREGESVGRTTHDMEPYRFNSWPVGSEQVSLQHGLFNMHKTLRGDDETHSSRGQNWQSGGGESRTGSLSLQF